MSTRWLVASFAGMMWLLAGATWARPARVESGAIRGVLEDGVSIFMGVPYAAPPLGELRWREPQPVARWKGVRGADSFAPACMQKGVSMPGEAPPTVSEDCLYLNIWTPAAKAGERLPVIVWIHGGGYTNGSASMPLYWGDRLARRGVVVVTIAYRLGPLGFLAHADLTRESAHRTSGNYGLLDQIAALEWIKRNIAVFGGDASRVTIAGQSAGAMSVSMLMASPRAKGLFHGPSVKVAVYSNRCRSLRPIYWRTRSKMGKSTPPRSMPLRLRSCVNARQRNCLGVARGL